MEENLIYQRKYSYLKKTVKRFVYENAALCDQVFQLQEKVICAREERNFLSKRLAQYHPPEVKTESVPSPSNVRPQVARRRDTPVDRPKPRMPRQSGKKRKILPPAEAAPPDVPTRFPIKFGNLSIHALGDIVTDRPNFIAEDMIYPVGFCSTRLYGSVADPTTSALYTCMILDGGSGPLFQISSDVAQDKNIAGLDINAVHGQLLQHINMSLGVEVVSTRGRGADFFGLTHPNIIGMLYSMAANKKGVSIKKDIEACKDEGGASVMFETLQRSIMFTRSQIETIRQQETLDSTTTLRDLLNS